MTTNTNTAPDNCTILPDGSAFALASYPLPKDHWLYAPREYEPGAEEPKELPHPILTHAHRAEVVAAVRYAIRSATMCGKEKDFDPDALVQNAVYALCGPYGKAALSTAAQPQEELREDTSYESVNLAVMVLSDCGHSSNYTPLLERVAGRIDRHVERLLTAQRADLTRRAQAEPAAPASQDAEDALVAALIECDRQTESMRIWDGMGYRYHPPQARQIHDTARAAIDAARGAQGESNG